MKISNGVNNQQEKKSIRDAVLSKIKKGDVKMRPKTYFLLKTILIVAGVLVACSLIIFLISFISFHLLASGIWYLPSFGFRGFGIYLRLLPWFLIFISLALILVLEILSKRFSFVWRRPIFYSLLAIILIALIGGFIIDKTSFHSGLFLQARQGRLPLAGPVYRDFGMPRFKDVHRGVVEEVTENGFLLRKADDELLTVILTSGTRFPFGKEIKEGDSVVVMGEREDDTVQTFGIRKIDDEFRSFERRLPRPPMRIR